MIFIIFIQRVVRHKLPIQSIRTNSEPCQTVHVSCSRSDIKFADNISFPVGFQRTPITPYYRLSLCVGYVGAICWTYSAVYIIILPGNRAHSHAIDFYVTIASFEQIHQSMASGYMHFAHDPKRLNAIDQFGRGMNNFRRTEGLWV